jgi:hypothetical protein
MDERVKVENLLCKEDVPLVAKLKEEYSNIANDLNGVFFWMQRELLASQTLTDLALKSKEKKDVSPMEGEDEVSDSPEPEKPAQSNAGEDNWAHYIPPSQTTNTILETTNKTQDVLANPTSSAPANLAEELLSVAHALEDLSCGSRKRPSTTQFLTPTTHDLPLQPKPKKRRRRRHEIVRNFKCVIDGCSKSYGSEGALKTHIRLKHTEGSTTTTEKKEPWYTHIHQPNATMAAGVNHFMFTPHLQHLQSTLPTINAAGQDIRPVRNTALPFKLAC